MSAVLVLLVLLPALTAGVSLALGGKERENTGRLCTGAATASFMLAVAVGIYVVAKEPVVAAVERSNGEALIGLSADRISIALLLLVCGVSSVAQAFARRYLRGDARATHFFAATGLLTTSTAALVTATTFIGLAVAWSLAGVSLCLLLATYRGLPAADQGLAKTARSFIIGDLALWAAVAVATATWGNIDLRQLGERSEEIASGGAAVTVVATLLVVAAIARSAQLPLQGWLPATLAAPTPVSALLHAGVVNAGGILLVRLGPLFGASSLATGLAFTVGATTAIYGTALMLTKPDIKGSLAHSTTGQMGFMLMTCGLGAFAAAVFHLIGHGMYKATLFLGSGAAVRRHVRHRKAPPAQATHSHIRGAVLTAVAVVAPAATLTGSVLLLQASTDGSKGSEALLLIFAWATAAWAGWRWLHRHPSATGVSGLLGSLTVASLLYVALLTVVTEFFTPALAEGYGATVPEWALVPVLLLLAALTAIWLAPPTSRVGNLHKQLYVFALGASQVKTRLRKPPSAANAKRSSNLFDLVPDTEGGRT